MRGKGRGGVNHIHTPFRKKLVINGECLILFLTRKEGEEEDEGEEGGGKGGEVGKRTGKH